MREFEKLQEIENGLLPCPFCGGHARITAKRIPGTMRRNYGESEYIAKWRVRAICNRCRALGSSVNTDDIKSGVYLYSFEKGAYFNEIALPIVQSAVNKWNGRHNK